MERAQRAEKAALELSRRLDERTGIALCLEALAWTAAAQDDCERAATLQGASHSIWSSIPAQLPRPIHAPARACEQRVTERLGAPRQQRFYNEGQRMDRSAAVALALDEPVTQGVRPVDDHDAPVLSRREDEVAALVAEGLTDREIANRLVISQRTAESHVQHILAKLGFRSRTQIATWFARH